MRAWIASKGVHRTEPEYELRDALGQAGCAVCRLALRTAVRQLDTLSYENVNDLDLRAKLRDARGFCNRHAWQLLEQTRDPLGIALIYKDVINTLIPELRPDRPIDRLRAVGRLRGSAGLAGRLAATRACPVCLAEGATEDVYLRLLGTRVAEPSFREAWMQSSGLCWPHLLAALPRARSDEGLALLALLTSPRQQPAPTAESGSGAAPETGSTETATPPTAELTSPGRGRPLPLGETGTTGLPLGEGQGEGNAEADPFPLAVRQGQSIGAHDLSGLPLPLGEGQGECNRAADAVIRALALSHGRWSADRSLLPTDLIVDLQLRRLEAVTRPAGARAPDCHACRAVAEGMERELAAALAGGLDPESFGRTCERHAWQLAGKRTDTLRIALAALAARRREALAVALARGRAERPGVIQPGQTSAGWIGGRAAALLRNPGGATLGGCALCDREAVLGREVSESAVGMRPSVALCRIHLMIAVRLEGGTPRLRALLEHQAGRWKRLSAALAEFIRKHDYRFSQETRGDERDSPWLAVEEIAGRKGGK